MLDRWSGDQGCQQGILLLSRNRETMKTGGAYASLLTVHTPIPGAAS